MSERTSTKQKPMPSMLKSIQRSAQVASAAVDNITERSSSTVGQRERQSLLGNDSLAEKSGGGAGHDNGPGGVGGHGHGHAPPKAPAGMKMSGRHQKMKNVMDNISRRLQMTSRGEKFGFRGRDKLDATGKKYRVEVPKNMLAYVACVFFVLPLVLGLYILLRQLFHGEETHSRYVHHPLHGHHRAPGNATTAMGSAGHDLGLKAEEAPKQPKTEEEKEIMFPPKVEDGAAAAAPGDEAGGDGPGGDAVDGGTKGKAGEENESDGKEGGGDVDEKVQAGGGGKDAEDGGEDKKVSEKETEDAKVADGKTVGGDAKTYDEEVREEIADDGKDKDGGDAAALEGKVEGNVKDSGIEITAREKDGTREDKDDAAEEKEDTAKRRLQGFILRHYWP